MMDILYLFLDRCRQWRQERRERDQPINLLKRIENLYDKRISFE